VIKQRAKIQSGARAIEANLSTKPTTTFEDARIQNSDAEPGRPSNAEAPPAEGPPPTDPLKARLTPNAFPKQFRLLTRGEFRRVYEEGQRRSAPLCTIFFRANGLNHSRLGITTPTRLGKAVLRNRIKRRLREVFRLNRAAMAPGWDMIVNPRPAAATAAIERLTAELLRLFPKAPPGAGKAELKQS
jgi:ribonuclease P protein component